MKILAAAALVGALALVGTPAAAAEADCTVTASTMTWGFKESFRSYISGAIAHGQWTVSDGASYATPDFGWADGVGSYNPDGGVVSFSGAITFTGHQGILNTTVANPQLRFVDRDSAVLLLDVVGTTQQGAPIDEKAVEFVDLDLSGLQRTDAGLAIAEAPAVLTAAGAEAFGTYEAGEQFDPVSFTVDVGDCAAADQATAPAPAAPSLTWVWALAAVVLLLIAAALELLRRRKR